MKWYKKNKYLLYANKSESLNILGEANKLSSSYVHFSEGKVNDLKPSIFYKKYLKYKQQYIQLKKLLNKN